MKTLTQVSDSAGAMLLRALLDEVQQQRQPWRNTAETEQKQVIDRLRLAVDKALKRAVKIVAQAGFRGIAVELDGINIKDPPKITLLAADDEEDRALHALVDNRKKKCVLVFAPDLEQFEAGMDRVQADADQPDLPLESGDLPLGEPEAPRTSKGKRYIELFKAIYGKAPHELDWEERRTDAVRVAHATAFEQLAQECLEGDIAAEDLAPASDETPPPVHDDGSISYSDKENLAESPPAETASAPDPAPAMTKEAALEILKRAEDVNDPQYLQAKAIIYPPTRPPDPTDADSKP